MTLSLGEVVERVSQDLEGEVGDSAYGVGSLMNSEAPPKTSGKAREIATSVVAEIATSIGLKALGM